jgi:Fe-S cluster biogenesis protein NfuA
MRMGDVPPTKANHVDTAGLEIRARLLSHLMEGTCGGGVEVVDTDKDGVVRVRFTGLCTACNLRPATFARWVNPGFSDVSGVTAVEAAGSHLSAEATERLVGSAAKK